MITSFFVNLSGSFDVNLAQGDCRRTVNLPLDALPPQVADAFHEGVAWLEEVIVAEGESFRQTLVEPAGWFGNLRPVYAFALTLEGPQGNRTKVVTTEAMPEGLRHAVLEAIQHLEAAVA